MIHILDSLQGLHFLLKQGSIKKSLKKHDYLASFISCLIHDYEHPGYSNQFVVRTKHPLAIRYNDMCVLENHHLAAGFAILLGYDKCNIIENMPHDEQAQTRKFIIEAVLNTDLSKHFSLLTMLKSKLSPSFPSDSFEDRSLILSISLRAASSFKVVRDKGNFFRWMDKMFEEFYR